MDVVLSACTGSVAMRLGTQRTRMLEKQHTQNKKKKLERVR